MLQHVDAFLTLELQRQRLFKFCSFVATIYHPCNREDLHRFLTHTPLLLSLLSSLMFMSPDSGR